MTNPRVEFFLYSRKYCHLCDDFLVKLESLLKGMDYTCHVIDVDENLDLKRLYGARIPVLVANNVELCETKFDEKTICQYLELSSV